MTKRDIAALLQKHDEEIMQLKIATSQMMLIWRIVGALAILAFGKYLGDL